MTLGDLRKKFAAQKADAKRRGILFSLTFEAWLAIWKASGRLAQRGHGRGRYVMARIGDRGGYEIGNVEIVLFEQNARNYRPTLDAKTRTGLGHRGKLVSSETRAKLAQKAKARAGHYSEATRLKMSVSRKRSVLSALRDESGRFA